MYVPTITPSLHLFLVLALKPSIFPIPFITPRPLVDVLCLCAAAGAEPPLPPCSPRTYEATNSSISGDL